jgi:hypothetical protein
VKGEYFNIKPSTLYRHLQGAMGEYGLPFEVRTWIDGADDREAFSLLYLKCFICMWHKTVAISSNGFLRQSFLTKRQRQLPNL